MLFVVADWVKKLFVSVWDSIQDEIEFGFGISLNIIVIKRQFLIFK